MQKRTDQSQRTIIEAASNGALNKDVKTIIAAKIVEEKNKINNSKENGRERETSRDNSQKNTQNMQYQEMHYEDEHLRKNVSTYLFDNVDFTKDLALYEQLTHSLHL